MIAVWALAIGLLATVAPFVSVGLATVFAWAGRTEHRRTTNAVNFHAKRPDKRGNEALATVGLPWHMVRALVELVPSFITAAVAGVGIVTVGWWLVDSGLVVIQEGPTGASWSQALFLALGGLAFVFLLWWGPWSRATRQGGARVAYALSRVDGTARGWTVLGLIVLGALVVAALLRTEQWWWPLASVAL